MATRLEVHEHCYITGPYAHSHAYKFSHSHDGGDVPHTHDDGVSQTGPAARTIDKDEWYAATGLRGGSRKKFTLRPSGVQLPMLAAPHPQIHVVVVGDGGASIAKSGTGGAELAVARMRLAVDAHVAGPTRAP